MITNTNDLVGKTSDYMKNLLEGESSGHDWIHALNVLENAREIAAHGKEVNLIVIELTALLHDISDWKGDNSDENSGSKEARVWLESIGSDEKIISDVCNIIDGVTYYGSSSKDKVLSIEGQIVRDADRLEAMGERAVERTRKFGEKYGIPEISDYMPILDLTEEQYKNFRRKENSFVNHFFEKLLLLRNRLTTNWGRKIGDDRHGYMKKFIKNYLEKITPGSIGYKNVSSLLGLLEDSRYK